MSNKKRVFDKDLGVELVLDEEVEEGVNNSRSKQSSELIDGRSKKRAKLEPSQTNSEQKTPIFNQQTQSDSQQQSHSRLASVANQTTSRFESKDSLKEANFEDESDSENLEEIDYGEDDDDDEFTTNNNEHNKRSNDDLHSKNTRQRSFERGQDDEHENIEQNISDLDDDDTSDEDMAKDDHESEEGVQKEPAERCKYWPQCTAGDDCAYYHPTKMCRAFPKCRFGQKCLFIHPPCKFGNRCERSNCSFAHPVGSIRPPRRQGPSYFRAVLQPGAPRCKYGSQCSNPLCTFSHSRPEPCRFGANCLLENCAFMHPSDSAKTKPSSAFKWSAES